MAKTATKQINMDKHGHIWISTKCHDKCVHKLKELSFYDSVDAMF
jgi:hypothetical protein